MIKMISIDKILHHPDNPRKDLGDLTELAESIKQSGILQNLTLVPLEVIEDYVGAPEYYAVIGNRRLDAAKIAGLKEVPCAIVEMDHKTQVATMLLENMQRSDLTVYEQAQGFQMMLELGESVADISEKTGFSDSTVRRRMKLLELDQEKLKETAAKGATLKDYMELAKIEDIETRNKVLEDIGTSDFNFSLARAISEEERKKKLEEMLTEIKTFATEIEDSKGYSFVDSYYGPSRKLKIPEDAHEVEYFYKIDSGWIYLYSKKEEPEKDIGEKEKQIAQERLREERKEKLEEISRTAYELRCDFIKGLSNTKARKHMNTIIEATIYTMQSSYCTIGYVELVDLFSDEDIKYEEGPGWEDVSEHIKKQPELNLLLLVHDTIDSERKKYFNWKCEYTPNEGLDYIYDLLKKLGYKISEEEAALRDGTHELFKEGENQNE